MKELIKEMYESRKQAVEKELDKFNAEFLENTFIKGGFSKILKDKLTTEELDYLKDSFLNNYTWMIYHKGYKDRSEEIREILL